jgi:hypothetical protein
MFLSQSVIDTAPFAYDASGSDEEQRLMTLSANWRAQVWLIGASLSCVLDASQVGLDLCSEFVLPPLVITYRNQDNSLLGVSV